MYMPKHEWVEGGKQYLTRVLENPDLLEKHLKAIERAADLLYNLNIRLLRLKPEALSLSALGKWYDRFHKAQHELWGAGMVPNLLELNQAHLSLYLRSYVERQQGRKISQEVWQKLITPTKLSWAQKEERAFLKLVVTIGKNSKLRRELHSAGDDLASAERIVKTFPNAWQALCKHHLTFCWIQYGWTGPAPDIRYYLDLLVRMMRQGDAARILAKTLTDDVSFKKKQLSLEHSRIQDKRHRDLLILLRRILFDKAYRVDALYQGYFAIEPILRELAKRLSLSLNQIYMIYGAWMPKILREKRTPVSMLNEALKYSAFIKEGDQLRFYIGKMAEKKMAPILKALPKEKRVNELKGECGYPGKVRGIVRIVAGNSQMLKVGEGDVLVSQATDPSYLPAMKKAVAFVTDMGGLTAHAAIVAREMKKPCVIGTRNATIVFKDGDRIEVDATRGIVRKLK